jgi:xylulokinase
MAKYLIGCDIGTSSAKAVLTDLEGNIWGSHYVEYNTYTSQTGWLEHNPEDYWRIFKENIAAVLCQSGVLASEVAGIGMSSCSPCCVLVDREGRTLGNSQIWMDRRGVAECDAVREIYDDDEIFRVSANPLDAMYGAIKLLWVKNHQPEVYRRTYKMLSPANFVNMRLTGEFVTDYSNGSVVGIIFDIVKREWRMDMAEKIGLDPDKLTRLAPCHEVIGTVTPRAAAECGLVAGTPVVAGTVDSNAAWLGNGCSQPGDASLVLGTAACMCVVHDTPRFTRNLMNTIHVADSERMYTTLAGTACCGGLLRYMRDCFAKEEAAGLEAQGKDIYDLFSEEALKVPPGSDGLVVLPYFAGERTPLWNPVARGMVFGISLSHTRGNWIRAMMESGIYAVYHCLKLMQESGLYITKPMLVSEGGANSSVWRQITSDILNLELTYMKNAKGAPMGNAINAGVGVGLFKNYDVAKEFIAIDKIHKPDPGVHKVYESYYKLYRKLYEDNKGNYNLLWDLKND